MMSGFRIEETRTTEGQDMKRDTLRIAAWVVALTAIGAIFRLAPHAPNFTPIAAVALFAGYMLPGRWAIVAPLAAMLIGDAVLGGYEWQTMLLVYTALLAPVALGPWLRKSANPLRVGGASIGAALLFFVVTNFGTWAFSGIYPHTSADLVAAYAMGLPFLKNTLASGILWSAVFFGAAALVDLRPLTTSPAPRAVPLPTKA